MAFEERIISFYPDEVHEALIKNIDKLAPDVQKNIKKISINSVEHTDTILTSSSQKSRYQEIMDIPIHSAALFYCSRGDKPYGFYLDDNTLIEILIGACVAQGIKLPREGEKSIIATDFYTSLKIKLSGSQSLTLED